MYTSFSLALDTFMSDNPGDLVVVAAGNDGADYGFMSIGAPATAKNSLTVGAYLPS